MSHCPNCGQPVKPTASLCPNCGALLGGVWPPPPEGASAPSLPPRPKALTGRVWTDFLLGAIAPCLTHLAAARGLVRLMPTITAPVDRAEQMFEIGFFVMGEMFWAVVFGLVMYYGLRRSYPFVSRGSGYATLLLLMVLLGAFFTCHALLYSPRVETRGWKVPSAQGAQETEAKASPQRLPPPGRWALSSLGFQPVANAASRQLGDHSGTDRQWVVGGDARPVSDVPAGRAGDAV